LVHFRVPYHRKINTTRKEKKTMRIRGACRVGNGRCEMQDRKREVRERKLDKRGFNRAAHLHRKDLKRLVKLKDARTEFSFKAVHFFDVIT